MPFGGTSSKAPYRTLSFSHTHARQRACKVQFWAQSPTQGHLSVTDQTTLSLTDKPVRRNTWREPPCKMLSCEFKCVHLFPSSVIRTADEGESPENLTSTELINVVNCPSGLVVSAPVSPEQWGGLRQAERPV